MAGGNDYSYTKPGKSVLLDSKSNVQDSEVVHVPTTDLRITRKTVEELAIEKYRCCGKGITYQDLQSRCSLKKNHAQRSLKHFYMNQVLFTAGDLTSKGIILLQNTNPQQYFPVCIKTDILEDLKKRTRNVHVEPTGSNLIGSNLIGSNLIRSTLTRSNHPSHGNALSNVFEHQKAQSFLDILINLPFTPLHIHKLQLSLSIDKEYYQDLAKKAEPINLAKRFEQHVGRRYVIYTFSPNGRVEIAIRSSDTPFKLEDEEDICILFSFFGQVRDRLICYVSDIQERGIPLITEWILKECDLNKDIEIDAKAQLYLPDIQLKYAGQVFRMYIKSLHDRSGCRVENSLTIGSPLVHALDGILLPAKEIHDLTEEIRQLKQMFYSRFMN
jgi:hypothetical protein